MINSREFWNEAKSSFRLLISRPSFILTTAPALIFSYTIHDPEDGCMDILLPTIIYSGWFRNCWNVYRVSRDEFSYCFGLGLSIP